MVYEGIVANRQALIGEILSVTRPSIEPILRP